MSYKKDIENFDYNKRYKLPNEHKWCFMYKDDNAKKYWDKKAKESMPHISRVQADEEHPEITGQIGTMIK